MPSTVQNPAPNLVIPPLLRSAPEKHFLFSRFNLRLFTARRARRNPFDGRPRVKVRWFSPGQVLLAHAVLAQPVMANFSQQQKITSVPRGTRNGTTWTQQQKLVPDDPLNGDRFGASVALSFGNLVVGAAEKSLESPNGQGAAYFYVLGV
jgi:hypothetical protein